MTQNDTKIVRTATAGDGGERVRHVKRGTEYEVLGEAEAQVAVSKGWRHFPTGVDLGDAIPAALIHDGHLLTVYRCATTGKLWCRFTDEFRDGRFETIAQAPAVQAPAGEDEPQHDLWCMHIQGPNELSAAPDFWTALAWSAELNTCVASRAIKQKWAEDDNWPRTQAVVARWPWAAEDHAECLTKELALRAAHEARRKATSPTPTDAQPKAARPVGDEALREAVRPCTKAEMAAFEEWARLNSYEMEEHPLHYIFMDKRTDAARMGWKAGLAFAEKLIASHPTTGQETVATPRAYGTDWAAVVANGLVGKTGDDVAACLRHAHSCGYTEGYGAGKNYEQAKVATPSPAQEPEKAKAWNTQTLARLRSVAVDLLCAADNPTRLDATLRKLYNLVDGTLATPSPAQEPGTGDTGETEGGGNPILDGQASSRLEAACRAYHPNHWDTETPRSRSYYRMNMARALAATPATPATTAETRGPAEGAR